MFQDETHTLPLDGTSSSTLLEVHTVSILADWFSKAVWGVEEPNLSAVLQAFYVIFLGIPAHLTRETDRNVCLKCY